MTNYRALCARMADELDQYRQLLMDDRREVHALAAEARTALAEPEHRMGPTDDELLSLDQLREAWNAQADAMNSWDELGIDEIIWWAQRQALARWGNHPVSPESSTADDEMAELATAEIVRRLRTRAATEKANRCHYSAKLLTRAADLLAQPRPAPVPVSERLPGAEDCAPWPGEPDATPWAWAGKCVDDSWEWTQLSMLGMSSDIFARFIAGGGWTYWLPHHALPIPTP